ncbi:Dehydrogenase/reductase SDR family member 7B [Seminavis robusta]|uniref:Dehydrogenase/reductase SDR family member 7B n=1 Tax=Seminavis robusta TaxID=568900 RepID=A0A9N8DCW9_9STRA|nr:Dehydrogenase/reductase SDR family member 7B [Seminavis robusta]|eukprot:Sro85_g045190.1 Dehydrogenase/reductase SDR family member 7B (286) ;mRNA; r:23413-24346
MATTTCSNGTKARFEGKNVLLTGASSGLGRSLALQLASCGVQTLLLSARKQAELEKVKAQCETLASESLDVQIVLADLSDKESVAKLAESARTANIDVLVNNGGVSSRSDFVDTSIEVDETVMQINFLSGAALAKAVVPGMIQKGQGAIIWISSVQGLLAIPSRTSYCASKHAVQGYCESMRAELASTGVTVHVASPGYIRTNLSLSAVTGDGKAYGKVDPTTAAGADPDEVAVTILDAVTKGSADFTVASGFSATVAIYLRTLCPAVLRSLLNKRYEKSKKKDD